MFGSMLSLHDFYRVLLSLSICCSLCLKPSSFVPLFFHQRPTHLLKLLSIGQYLWDGCLSLCSVKGGFLLSISRIFCAFFHKSFTHWIKIVYLSLSFLPSGVCVFSVSPPDVYLAGNRHHSRQPINVCLMKKWRGEERLDQSTWGF